MPFIDRESMHLSTPIPGWSARYFHSDHVTVSHWEIDEGAVDLHEHDHPYEETWNVVAGAALLVLDGQERRLGAGDAAVVPAGRRHAVRVLGPCRAVVVDHPVRQDFPGQQSVEQPDRP